MNLTKNFELSEFQSKDGAPFPSEVVENLKKLAAQLQVLRDHANSPVRVNSGYRSPAHNKRVGGSPNSQHMYGKAGDITVDGMTPAQVHATITDLIKAGKMKDGGLGRYSSFTHYDIREVRARW